VGRLSGAVLFFSGSIIAMTPSDLVVFTIGHSTRPLEEFIGLLRAHEVDLLVDVRKMPRSRRNPQFNRDTLPAALKEVGIGYMDMPDLGGLRRRTKNSPNGGWKNPSFQAFADYMQTPEFDSGVRELIDSAQEHRACIMCAEAVPWRCHRSLIADALVIRGIHVEHIIGAGRTLEHVLKPLAHVEGLRITYPPAQ
jgi:uncharacterized protein (DUF488 family)